MLPAEFEPTVPASKLPQTHALDHAAGGVGSCQHLEYERVTAVCDLGKEYTSCLDALTEGIQGYS
jgi:hypothetical protein